MLSALLSLKEANPRTKAFFGRPVASYVKGGAHLSIELILRKGDRLLMLRRPEGLYGGPKNSLYFPHEEFLFGEDLGECIKRVVREQTNIKVVNYRVVDFWSWVAAEKGHWHLCVVCVAEVEGEPKTSPEVSEYVSFTLDKVPKDMAWWKVEELKELMGRVS